MKRLSTLLTVALTFPGSTAAWAQAARFELGQRLRAFETDFEKYADPAGRMRAVPSLRQTMWLPLATSPGLAGQTLDHARFALRSAELPPPEVLWAESLWLDPACRFIDVRQSELELALKPFYPVAVDIPKRAHLRLTLSDQSGKLLGPRLEVAITEVPMRTKLGLTGLKEGDHVLHIEVLVAGKVVLQRELMLSSVVNQSSRLASLQQALAAVPAQAAAAQRDSVRYLASVLTGLADQATLETNYPACRLLAESESAIQALTNKNAYYTARRPGEFWLTLPAGGRSLPVRMLVPEAAAQGKPLPLVVALHGSSGSENLFFEGHGRGAIVRLCRERSWLLVAPRLSFVGTLPIPELVDEINRLYPVAERQVFLIGHSLGAAQAVFNTSQNPDRFAAVAALGGGGLVRASERLKAVPFFIGVGSEDIAFSWARNLRQGLQSAGVRQLAFREYPAVEHLAITQAALADVFRWLDEVARRDR